MNEQKNNRTAIDRPFIKENPCGGTIYICAEEGNSELIVQLEVNQYEIYAEDNGKIRRVKRTGYIGGSDNNVDVLLHPDMEYQPGERVGGHIQVLEGYEPPNPDNPEWYIKKDSNGDIVRVDGRVVYHIERYCPDATVPDVLIE